MNSVNHNRILDVLRELQSSLDAAQVHGMLCGLLCTAATASAKARWFGELLDSAALETDEFKQHVEDLKMLEKLCEETVSGLNSPDLTFQLLLPDDTQNIDFQTDALAAWCGGFTSGIGLGMGAAGTTRQVIPDDTEELLRDFAALSNAVVKTEADDESDDESDEESLLALQEYVRVGVLLINEELTPAPTPKKVVH